MSLGQLKTAYLLMGGALRPPCLLLGLGLLSPDGWGQIFSKPQLPEELTLVIISETSASNVLSPKRATATLCFFLLAPISRFIFNSITSPGPPYALQQQLKDDLSQNHLENFTSTDP